MREFSLIFCHRKSWNPISWAIRKLQRFPSSHCVIHWKSDSLDRLMYYDASLTGVSFKNDAEFKRHYNIDKSVIFKTDDFKQLVRFCIDNLDKDYSFSLLFYHFFLILGLKVPFLARGKDPICTTLAALALSEVGVRFDMPLRDLDLVKLYKMALEYSGESEK